jgi:hypothetical protein
LSYYTQTRRQTVGSSTGQHLARIAAALEAAGATIPKDIQQATDATWTSLERVKELREESNPEAHMRAVEAKIADGTATVNDIMGAASARTLVTTDPISPFANMFTSAETLISRDTHKAFSAHGDKWITHTLRPLVNKNVATILDAAPETLRVEPDQEPNQLNFLNHIPAVAEAWGNLTTIYQNVRQLRGLGVLPSTYQRDDCYEYDGDPGKRDGMQDTNITWFVWAARNGHTPGIYTEAENKHHWNQETP